MTPKLLTAAITAAFLIPAPPIYANDADCAIWLCLPVGFPSGCGDAKQAFINRIKSFKSPLPSLTSCLVSSGVKTSTGTLNSIDGYAAFI